jgi:ADP-ribosylglycohydrolase
MRLLTGLEAGDSLGSTSEFVPQKNIPALYNRVKDSGWPFRQVGRGTYCWNPGDPTDDTELALCILRSGNDPSKIAKEFLKWYQGPKVDIGYTTSESLRILSKNQDEPYWFGGFHLWKRYPTAYANGFLMRNGVVAGMATSLEDAYQLSLQHGMITHYAILPQICCLAQTYLIWELLNGKGFSESWQEKFQESLDHYFSDTQDPEIRGWLKEVAAHDTYEQARDTFTNAEWDMNEFNPFNIDFGGSGGYCLLTLQIAIWGLYWSLRKDAPEVPKGFPPEVFEAEGSSRLGWVAMVGYDPDTYGAAAGSLIAAAHSSLPSGMTDGLKALTLIDDLHLT